MGGSIIVVFRKTYPLHQPQLLRGPGPREDLAVHLRAVTGSGRSIVPFGGVTPIFDSHRKLHLLFSWY